MSITRNKLHKGFWGKFIVPLGFIVLWIFLNKFVSQLYLPKFLDTIHSFRTIVTNTVLWIDIRETFGRLFWGFALSCLVAIPLGVLVGSSLKVYNLLEYVVDFFRSIPSSSFYPLFLLVFGIGNTSKIAIVAYTTGMIIFVNTVYGIQKSSKLRAKMARLYGASKITILTRVTFFDALPQIFIGLRVGISIALVIEIVAEMIMGTNYGLGRRMIDSYISYNIPKLYSLIFIVGILGLILAKLFALAEKKVVHWISFEDISK